VNLGGKKMLATILVPHVACHRCSMGCSRWVRVPEGPYTMDAPGPEFETLGALGANCMTMTWSSSPMPRICATFTAWIPSRAAATNRLCDGMFREGLLTLEDTGGIELTFGNKEAMLAVIQQIAFGQGIGPLLRWGRARWPSASAASPLTSPCRSKAWNSPCTMRGRFSVGGATYATGPRGGCHLHGMSSIYEGKDAPLPEWDLNGNYPRHSDDHKGKIARLARTGRTS